MSRSAVIAGSPTEVQPAEAEARRARPRLGGPGLWGGLAVLVTIGLAACIPLLSKSRYYFLGDTQVGAFGQWFHLGEKIRGGEWPLLDPSVWLGGNFVAEGQWGLFSPVSMGIGVLASLSGDAVVFSSLVKITFLLVGGLGAYLLARSYDVPAAAAYVAGVAAPLGGQTMYFDAPSWVTGLMVWSLVPWTWWATRRTMLLRASPWPALLAGYLTVSVGYVFGTLMLAIVLFACLVDAALARNRTGFLKVLVIGVCTGLVALTVYLPGILSASVTKRSGWDIANGGFMVADVGGFLSSPLPTALANVEGWWGEVPRLPLMYIAWFLPLLVCVDWSRVRAVGRDLVGIGLVGAASLAWVTAPSRVGPIRFPMRMMPFVVLCVVVLAAVLVARARLARWSRGRLFVALAFVGVAAYLSAAQVPHRWRAHAVAAVLCGIGVTALWFLLRDRARLNTPRLVAAAAFVGAWSMLLLAVQHHYYPKPTAAEWALPADISAYQTQLPDVRGDVFVVGRTDLYLRGHPQRTREVLMASAWYVNPKNVQNRYSPVGFAAYGDRYCYHYHGGTCTKALSTLLGREPTTGERRVDLLSVSSIVMMKQGQSPARLSSPPEGWTVAGQSAGTVTWVREDVLPGAGGVTWSSPGTEVSELSRSSRTVRLRVDEVPSGGGQLVLSRLDYPGYQVSGGSVPEPVDGYLLTVDVPADSAGETIEVHYAPPAWGFAKATYAAGVGIGLVWVAVHAVGWWRRRSGDDTPTTPAKPSISGEPA